MVAFVIMPLFALSNAGVALPSDVAMAFSSPITLGVIAGLVLGKPIGITLFAWLSVRIGLAERPTGVTWGDLHGVAWLGGIGFTMSLFIAALAFEADPALLAAAKIGVLAASTIAGVAGFVILRRRFRNGTSAAGAAV
jgi:NhaA family Na+:H+ antiporter